ncbi:MAG: hypothetical protein JST31_01260 [Actinobacteria bacterium]|nr:hypothetical protein [Actinomycetota bacterium]
MLRRRPLTPAWMLEGVGRESASRGSLAPHAPREGAGGRRAETRADALSTLDGLFDSGLLTRQQFLDERRRLLGG